MEEKYVKGTCETMCPKKEALLRQKENLLHKFEMKKGTECNKRPEFDPNRIIKSFSRSAAGSDTTEPQNLRPFPVLEKTVEYLYKEIFPLHTKNPILVYNFMFDRLRAVRQDLVIQNLGLLETIKILEPIVRFHVYFSYILVEEEMSDFDAHINNTHLQECLKRLLVCYDEYEKHLSSRWNIESVYLLFNLGNVESLTRGVRLCSSVKDKNYIYCLNLSFYWFLKNYIKVLRMIKNLPPLLLCAALISLPEIRKYVLMTMSYGYSSANSAFPVSHLKRTLLYETDKQVKDDCLNFNIKVNDDNINFIKKNFDATAKCKQGNRLTWVDCILEKCDLYKLLYLGIN